MAENAPNTERLHIAILGRTNVGKSSLVNALTNQDLAVVSPIAGTTTDPVLKAMELLPLGPVVMMDTPGLDDKGVLGPKRVEKTFEVLRKANVAILVTEASKGLLEPETAIIEELSKRQIPFVVAFNKADEPGAKSLPELTAASPELKAVSVSAKTKNGLEELKALLPKILPQPEERPLVRDLLKPGDLVVLVVPLDKAAPKGRLILPQQQVIRDALEAGAVPVVTRDTELARTLECVPNPKLVVTDSQAFGKVAPIVPETIPLTGFSILLSRAKGDLEAQVKAARVLLALKDHDPVLISEGCTHHRQCQDIGTIKIPGWIRQKLGINPDFHFTSGGEYPEDLSPYRLIIHCGGCMLTQQEMQSRMREARALEAPVTNYGMAIAALHGILARSLEIFPQVRSLLD